MISSTAPANDNSLTTGSLTFSNILNQANYNASTIGGSFSTSGGVAGNALANGASLLGSLTGPGGSTSGTTLSAISAGTINVLSDATTGANSTAGLSRNTTNTNGSIAPIFNLQQIQNNAAVGQAFGQIANQAVGDLLTSQQVPEDSTEGILLHGAIGALQGQISGGNALAGAAGGAASAEVSGIVDTYLASQGITKDNPATQAEYNEIQQATSQIAGTAIGAAVGAVSGTGAQSGAPTGGQTALSSTTYNYLNHNQASALVSAQSQLDACNSSGTCTADQVQQLTNTISTYTKLDASTNSAAEAACNTGGAAACQSAQTGIVNAVDSYLNQPFPAYSLTSYQLGAVSELGKVTSENGATLGTQLGAIQDSTLPGSTVVGAATAVVGGLTVASGITASGAGAAVDATAGAGSAGAADTSVLPLFRGTTPGYPGSPGMQAAGVTAASTDPAVATVFATGNATTYGNGVVHIATASDLAGVDILPAGNASAGSLPSLEAEVGVGITATQFENQASVTITAAQARAILTDMGIDVPSNISLGNITGTLQYIPKLTPEQAQQFVNAAKNIVGVK